jgi:hypothetical protein
MGHEHNGKELRGDQSGKGQGAQEMLHEASSDTVQRSRARKRSPAAAVDGASELQKGEK